MPRPIFRQSNQENQQNSLSNAKSENKLRSANPITQERLLRKRRSREYMTAFSHLDAGTHVMNKAAVNEIIEKVQSEFTEIEFSFLPLGYVSKCYLGAPYEVHVLNRDLSIVEHYKVGESLPDGMERARSLALHGGYEFIEVYSDCCRAVSASGDVSVIKN